MFRRAVFLASLAGFASMPLRAQDLTLLFADFEGGLSPGWAVTGPPGQKWHSLPSGVCGAVTDMAAFGASSAGCSYAGRPVLDSALISPSIHVTSMLPPFKLSFEYVLDVDASGDDVAISMWSEEQAIEIVFARSADFQRDGRLHSIVFDLPLLAPGSFANFLLFHVSTDDLGNLGRGWMIDNVRVSASVPGAVFCHGAIATLCPCANGGGLSWRGCANSTGVGTLLLGTGNPSLATDTFLLGALALPIGARTLFFEGTATHSTLLGDGRLCAGGQVVRLGTKSSSSGHVAYPEPGDIPISVRTGVAAGSTRYYQALYRNPGGPCGQGFNLSNGWSASWGP